MIVGAISKFELRYGCTNFDEAEDIEDATAFTETRSEKTDIKNTATVVAN